MIRASLTAPLQWFYDRSRDRAALRSALRWRRKLRRIVRELGQGLPR